MITKNRNIEIPILETLPILKLENRIGSIIYTDLEMDHSKGSDSFSTISLVKKTKNVSIQTHQISLLTQREIQKEVSNLFGVDMKQETRSLLESEMNHRISLDIVKKYEEIGLSQMKDKTNSKWKNWLTRVFGVKHVTHIKDDELYKHIIKISSLIHHYSKMGGAQFLISSPKIANIISENPGFVFSQENNKGIGNFSILPIGSLRDIKIYKNNFMGDDLIILGRTPSNGQPGVYFLDHSSEFSETEEYDNLEKTRIYLRSNHSIVEVGRAHNLYYTDLISLNKKPLWKKLLGI